MSTDSQLIFVQIPSYCDSQLVDTIYSLLNNACKKERLRISVCWQHSKTEKLPLDILENKNIAIIDINYKHSKGANWARSVVQKNWNNEPFTLLIDSHTRLAKNWDRKLIAMFNLSKANGAFKPVITGYPPSFDPLNYPKKRLNYPLKMYVEGYYYNLLTKFNGQAIPHFKRLKEPVPAHFISLGFLFAEGSFNREINFDPGIYFYGDEITSGLRAYCHGYDFFHPHRPVAWHLYDRKTRITHWDTHKNWGQLDAASCERILKIFQGREYDDFPLGSCRTIADYENYIGYKLVGDGKYN